MFALSKADVHQASPLVAGATQQAKAVVADCAVKGRCNAVIIIGGDKIFSFENRRLAKIRDGFGRSYRDQDRGRGRGIPFARHRAGQTFSGA